MRITKLIPMLLILLLLQGCINPRQIEQTAIINMRGVDLIDEDGERIVETTIVPYIFDPNAPEMTSLLIGRGRTIKEARDDAGKQSPYVLSPGKIEVEFFGKEAAEAGILPFLNPLVRDARVSDIMQLAITNQTARELLELEQQKVKINHTEYFENLIQKEIELDILPLNSLEYFTRISEQVGIDPVLPVIDIVDDQPTLTSIAVFNVDRFVGELTLKESFLINQMRKTVDDTPLEVEVPLENYKDLLSFAGEEIDSMDSIFLSLRLTRGKGRIEIVDMESLTFQAKVNMKLEILETSLPMDIKTEEIIKKLEQDIETYYLKKYEELFEKLQAFNSDAFGIGRKYVATRKGSKTTDEEWREMFPNTTLEFDINVTIKNFGSID